MGRGYVMDRALLMDALTGYRCMFAANSARRDPENFSTFSDEELSMVDILQTVGSQCLCEFMPMLMCAASETPMYLAHFAQQLLDMLELRAKSSPDVAQALYFLQRSYPMRYDILTHMDLTSAVLSISGGGRATKALRMLGAEETSFPGIDSLYAKLAKEMPGFAYEVPADLKLPHPFLADRVVKRMEVERVYNSKTRPRLVTLQHTSVTQALDLISESDVEPPDMLRTDSVILKHGDDIRRDAACIQAFRLMNMLFELEGLQFNDIPARAVAYGCLPIGQSRGLIECVEGCKSIRKIEKTIRPNSRAVDRLVATAASSYVSSYILGIRDRHDDNILVHPDGTCFHIDFGFVLNESPKLDASPFAITRDFHAILGHKWECFVTLCVEAVLILRKYSSVLVQFTALAFSPFSQPDKTRTFLAQSMFLGIAEPLVAAKVREMLEAAPKSYKTKVKNLVHKAR